MTEMTDADVRTTDIDEEFVSLEALEARATEIRERNAQISGWVRKALEWLAGTERLSDEAKALPETKEGIAAVQKKLHSYLRNEDSFSRQTAWMALFEYYFGLALKTEEAVREQLKRLVKAGFLKKEGNDLYAYNTGYTISSESMLNKEEIEACATMLKDLKNRVYQEIGKAREAKQEELLRSYSNDLEEMLAGKPGVYALLIPEENQKDENGEWIRRAGGVLVVESDGTYIKPLEAAGSIENTIKQAKELEVCLELASLSNDILPEIPGLDYATGAKTKHLWHLIRRAKRGLEEEKRVQALKDELSQEVTVSSEEWFKDKALGVCLAEHKGTWQRIQWGTLKEETEVSDILFLVERKAAENGNTSVGIVKMPEHLKDFFAGCEDEYIETKTDKKFESCPQPLRAVLQAIYGQSSARS